VAGNLMGIGMTVALSFHSRGFMKMDFERKRWEFMSLTMFRRRLRVLEIGFETKKNFPD
jgi:hypothetical protein